MLKHIEADYNKFNEDLIKFFKLLMRFLENSGPNILGEEHVMCNDMVHIRDSHDLTCHLFRISKNRRHS